MYSKWRTFDIENNAAPLDSGFFSLYIHKIWPMHISPGLTIRDTARELCLASRDAIISEYFM